MKGTDYFEDFSFDRWSRWGECPPFSRGWGGPMQARRGMMRSVLLRLLLDRPMHGYEMIRLLEEKSRGLWRPSPGSVYPLLQLLEEEDMVVSHETDGKKVYELTDQGRAEAEKTSDRNPWERSNDDTSGHAGRIELRVTMRILMGLAGRTIRKGSDEDVTKVKEILRETITKLEALQKTDEQ